MNAHGGAVDRMDGRRSDRAPARGCVPHHQREDRDSPSRTRRRSSCDRARSWGSRTTRSDPPRRQRASDRRQRRADSRRRRPDASASCSSSATSPSSGAPKKRIAEQREWFETTLESIGDAVIATDVHGRVVFMNPVAEHLTGWRADDAPRPALRRGVPHRQREDAPHRREPGRRASWPKAPSSGLANHTVLIAADGTERPIDDSGAPIRNRDGRIVGVVLVFRDVTERRRAERGATRRRAGARAAARGRTRRARRGRARQPGQGRVRRDGLARAAHPAERDPRLDAVDDRKPDDPASDVISAARRRSRATRACRRSSSPTCSTSAGSSSGKLRLEIRRVDLARSSQMRSRPCRKALTRRASSHRT